LTNPEDFSVIRSYLQEDDDGEDFLNEDYGEESDITSEDEAEERDGDSETEQECEETDEDSGEGTNYFLGKDKITKWSDNPPLRNVRRGPHSVLIFLELQKMPSQRKLLWTVGRIYLPTKSWIIYLDTPTSIYKASKIDLPEKGEELILRTKSTLHSTWLKTLSDGQWSYFSPC
jgi:hypothetical protein